MHPVLLLNQVLVLGACVCAYAAGGAARACACVGLTLLGYMDVHVAEGF